MAGAAALATGCATAPLDTARGDFYAGRWAAADRELSAASPGDTDRMLFLMERGMVRHVQGQYTESSRDWMDAVAWDERLQTYSVSRGASSLVVNDRVQYFRGMPFERTYLRTYLALNALAAGQWMDAAVHARNVIAQLEGRNGYPDDPFSRYLAGFCLELRDDTSNAALQYRIASGLLQDLRIGERTGLLVPSPGSNNPPDLPSAAYTSSAPCELVCFLFMGHAPGALAAYPSNPSALARPYAELYADGVRLGRSFTLVNTSDLVLATERQTAALSAVKTVSRLTIKMVLAEIVSQQNEALGDLLRVGLLALENPDTRHWETLPRWLGVARVPCPSDLRQFEVVFRSSMGTPTGRKTVVQPLQRQGRIYVAICRDLSPVPSALSVEKRR